MLSLKNALVIAALLAAALPAILAGCGSEPAPEPTEAKPAVVEVSGADLFNQSCGVCHRIEKAVAYSGKTPWKDIVARMIQHNAKITPENAAVIVKHLEETYPLKTE